MDKESSSLDNYKDVPDSITNVKQEILDEEVRQNANKDIRLKGIFKLQNVKKIVAHLKNSLKKNEETLDSRKMIFGTNENSNFVKKDPDSSTDCIQGSREEFIKVEQVNIKSENEEEDDSTSSKRIGQKQQDNSIVHICRYCPYPTDHLSQSGEVGTFRCEQCDFQTIYKDCFTMHLERHLEIYLRPYTKKPTLKCYHCDFVTIYKTCLIKHLRGHEYPEFKCHRCDYRTPKKENLYKHFSRHRNPKAINFKCDYCNYKTLHRPAFNKHIVQHL